VIRQTHETANKQRPLFRFVSWIAFQAEPIFSLLTLLQSGALAAALQISYSARSNPAINALVKMIDSKGLVDVY